MFIAKSLTGKRILHKGVCITLVILGLFSFYTHAQIIDVTSFEGNVYKQDFNSLPQTGGITWANNQTLAGWSVEAAGTTTLMANNGVTVTSGIYNFGNTTAETTSNRSLGSINNTSTQDFFYAVHFRNNTGKNISQIKVKYKMRMWRRGSNSETMDFQYAVASNILYGTSFTSVKELQATTFANSATEVLNGNIEYIEKSFLLQNLNIPAGYEFKFRWKDANSANWAVAIDDVEIQALNEIIYYNKTISALNDLSNWGTNQDGTGIEPTSFNQDNQIFVIYNYNNSGLNELAANWQVSGANSKIILGNGENNTKLRLTNNKTILGTIDVAEKATLVINTNQSPMLGELAPGSTVEFGANAPADITTGTTFGNVIFSSKKKNKFEQKVRIRGKLDLQSSQIELGDNDLELDHTATVLNASETNYIILNGKGKLKRTILAGSGEVLFPVGNTAYNPIKISLAAGAQSDVFSVGIIEGVYDAYTNDAPSSATMLKTNTVNKTWVVSEEVKGGSDIALTLSWNAADVLPGFNPASCHVKHYENGFWDEDLSAAATVTGTSYTITRTGIKSFSPFTVSSTGPSTLPVELLHFTAKAAENNTVTLNWATAMEKNNDYFAVERSQDGKNFTQIARVSGKGNTNSRTNYSFTDNNPLAGTAYYRLRQVDVAGTFENLPVHSVTLKGMQSLRLSLYPNPAQGSQVNLLVQGLASGEEVQVLVTDVMGSSVLQKRVAAGDNLMLAANKLKAGTYLVKVVGKAGAQTQKLVIR